MDANGASPARKELEEALRRLGANDCSQELIDKIWAVRRLDVRRPPAARPAGDIQVIVYL